VKLKGLLDNGYHLGNDDEPVTGQSTKGWEGWKMILLMGALEARTSENLWE